MKYSIASPSPPIPVIFRHPPTGTNNPLLDFIPSDVTQYPAGNGIYIYGIRIYVDNVLKFVPLVVGEGALKGRLHDDHYLGKFVNPLHQLLNTGKKSKDPKEIWDFSFNYKSKIELKAQYTEMDNYDHTSSKTNMALLSGLNNLIYFQNAEFFNTKLKLPAPLSKIDIPVEASVGYIMELSSMSGCNKADAIALISKIILTLQNFKNNFYYVYAQTPNIVTKDGRKQMEYDIKMRLKKHNIHTTAAADKKDFNIPYEIVLSNVWSEIVAI